METAMYYNAVALAAEGNLRRIAKLKKENGSWRAAYEDLRRGGSAPDPQGEWEKLQKSSIRLFLGHDASYPPLLKEIPERPFGIYVLGTTPERWGTGLALAIVGTRRATPYGQNVARRFAGELARAGFTIVSGLAFGIDAAAHEGCLEAGGTTVAVLAGGLHGIYPRENEKLAERILETGGAVISEYPLGAPPYPDRFLERNRIISGLSQGVLIVEAPEGSGSLVTARRALEQNRDVFAAPGPVTDPHFAGSHELIRQGVELVTRPEEIFEAYHLSHRAKIAAAEKTASPEEKQILEALRAISAPADVDKISAATTLEPHIVNRALSFLLLKHMIEEKEGGYTI